MAEIGLGTVQFGLDYGINNPEGKVPVEEVHKILETAFESGIDLLDTASAYGESEKILGTNNQVDKFKVVSKLPPCTAAEVRSAFEKSSEKLKRTSLDGYLIHDFSSYENDNGIWDELKALKAEARVKKIGFSLYFPAQLDLLARNDIEFDLVQVPYNIFDQRFAPYFEELKTKNVEIHCRSAFMQGLFFIAPDQLPDYFNDLRPALERLHSICKDEEISMPGLCLNFALASNLIDKVIIGVDSRSQLNQNIEDSKAALSEKAIDKLKSLAIIDEHFLIPSNWPS